MPAPPEPGRGRLTTAEDARRYVLGDHARTADKWTTKTLTLVSGKTDRSLTYMISRPPGDGRDRPWIVKILTGPDNRRDYVYLGLIRPVLHDEEIPWDDGSGVACAPPLPSTRLHHTRNSGLPTTAPGWRAFAYFFDRVIRDEGGKIPPLLAIWQEGRCGACGRRLTVQASIERGLGPTCASRLGLF